MKKLLLMITTIILPTIVFAGDITSSSKITINDTTKNLLIDKNENSYVTLKTGENIKISNDENINGIYIIYEMTSQIGKISSKEKEIKIGTNNFLHEYIDVANEIGETKEITLDYEKEVKIGEIYVLSKGDLPEFVEVWNPSFDKADLLLFTTHSDDEQLFFLGLIPTYIARGANVQVVYFAHHNDNPKRLHEQLHGLYVIGIRNYPVMGIIPDAYSESLEGAIKNIEKANITIDDTINFQVEMIRRFKPLVVVGHDELGEYSHGQHILNTHSLKISLEKANDKDYHLDTYEKYGIWNTPKTYLHLYKENQIIMNYDEPLEYYNGKTAYEVSKEGYKQHHSQQWTWFTKWINGNNNSHTKASDIKTYSPTEYGLYRTIVGYDLNKNDMFENLTLRKDQTEESEINKNNVTDILFEDKNSSYFYYIIGGITIFMILIIMLLYKKNRLN